MSDHAHLASSAKTFVRKQFSDAEQSARLNFLEQLNELDLPNRKQERWRYAPLRWLESFEFNQPTTHSQDAPVNIDFAEIAELRTAEVIACPVSDLANTDDAFSVINAALAQQSLQLTHNSADSQSGLLHEIGNGQQTQSYSARRNHIHLMPDSELLLVDVYRGEAAWNDVETSIDLDNNARLTRIRLQLLPSDQRLIERVQVNQAANSQYRQYSFDLGGLMSQADTKVVLAEPGAECHLNGLFFPLGKAHQDQHTTIEHRAENCVSREHYRGLANDQGRGVFNGRVLVDRGAQKTDSAQEIHTLLLSDKAEINAKPELEIYADDVRCAHGATAGQIDEAAAFYLASRGIDRETAHRLLLWSFLQPVLTGLPELVQAPIQQALQDFLPKVLAGVDQP